MNRLYGSLNSTIYASLPIFGQNLACTASGFLRSRNRFNAHFRASLSAWEHNMAAPLEVLHEIQRRRLAEQIDVARQHVPYYRDLEPAVEKADPTESMRETLASIHPLEKSAYRDDPQAFLSRSVPHRRRRRGHTSGTTGTALPLWHTPETVAEEYATVWRMRRRVGVDIHDPHLNFNGQLIVPVDQKTPPFHRINRYNRQTLFSIYHMTPSNLRSYVEAIHAAPGRYVQGYPSAIHIAARALLESGRPLPRGRLAAVFTSSESLLAFQRESIEEAFSAPILDRYGVSEFAVSMTECAAGRLHVDMEFCIVEVEVTEETDDSETGPLLITGLAPHATPFFRYRIGDVGTRAKHPCPCGRAGDSFLEVDGRIEDYVLTPDGNLVGRMDHVFKDQLDVAEAQIVQERTSDIDVLVVPRESYSESSERAIMRGIRQRLGSEIGVTIRRVSSIAREPNGKFRAVKSTVGRNAAHLQAIRGA